MPAVPCNLRKGCARLLTGVESGVGPGLGPSTGTLEESIEFTVSRPNCVGCVGAQCDVCVSYEDTMSGDELGWRESGYDERRINNWLGPDETWLRVFKGEAIIADGMLPIACSLLQACGRS